nr:EAL domain-containing protein [Lachnospiraceae bacterium]
MERYEMPEQERAIIERLRFPFAVYQFIDKRVVTLALSDGFCEKFGFSSREEAIYVMDNDMYRDTYPEDVVRVAEEGIRFATEGGVYDVIYRTKAADGKRYIVLHAHGEHVTIEKEGIRLAHIWYMDEGGCDEENLSREITVEHVLANTLREENAIRISRYDHLTGLPNLTYFLELFDAGKISMQNKGYTPAMMYLDLNGMKYYNHRKGFAEGDRMLQTFARLLKQTFGNENCCHIGADRFAVYSREEELEKVLKSFFAEAEKVNGRDSLPVRVGVYPYSIGKVSAGTAYDRAKVACDAIPATDISVCNFYDRKLSEYETKRRYIKANIDRAISENWIKVYYQPIVRALNSKVCDEEALARWIDPEKGFLSPADFIPHLEETGLIYKLDLYVLEQTLKKMKDMKERGLDVVSHSINLSRSDFYACDIVEEIRKRVDDSDFGRDMISIEITESIIGGEFEFMKKQIERFRELGFPVWMDDFGSGYSSLNVLHSIPFDLIKFDMSFLRRLDEGENGKIILTQLMKMATNL